MIAGFGGVLYAFYAQFLDPSLFGWTASSEWVIFLFFGGVNSLTGSILSTILLYTALPVILMKYADLQVIMYSILVLLILNFKQGGLMGEKEFTLHWLKTRIVHYKNILLKTKISTEIK
jgi:branched-chain amino acid transport system permease protein